MKKSDKIYQKQIFVCCNEKKDGTGCGPKGGEELRNQLKDKLNQRPELIGKIRVNKSGCMDFCKEAIAVQFQPSNQLILEAGPEDAERIWEDFMGLK